MKAFAIKGWCPTALRPMLSGDGLVVRIRPRGGRLSAAQALGIADLATRHGNGLIDLTGRANVFARCWRLFRSLHLVDGHPRSSRPQRKRARTPNTLWKNHSSLEPC